MINKGNNHGDSYNTHNIETGQGCWEILYRLNYSNGVATDYDNIKWHKQDEDYFEVTIGISTVRVRALCKQALETCIPVCQKNEATYTVSRIIYEMLPWFISHQAIWYADFPKGAEQVAIYTTPPTDFDQIKKGLSIHYFVAMNTAALFYKPSTAQFIDQWGSSGMNFKAMLTPSSEILTPSERAEKDRGMQRMRDQLRR
jgi:hypothetical protein